VTKDDYWKTIDNEKIVLQYLSHTEGRVELLQRIFASVGCTQQTGKFIVQISYDYPRSHFVSCGLGDLIPHLSITPDRPCPCPVP